MKTKILMKGLTSLAVSFLLVVIMSPALHAQSSDEVFDEVDEIPQYYQGGMDGLIKFISGELKYPEKAKKNKVEGTVFVSFIVEKNGSVSDAAISKGVEASLDSEALRVVKMTKWTPGKEDGKTVRVRFVVPIKYKV